MINPTTDAIAISISIIDIIFKNFDVEVMKLKLESKYKAFAVFSTISMMQNAINASKIVNDPGDATENNLIDVFKASYNY